MSGLTLRAVAWQTVLVLRTMRDVVRQPSRGRHFTRMLATLAKSPLELRQPWLPYELTSKLSNWVTSDTAVFEFGGGGSTIWFACRAGSVVTVEHDKRWLDRIRAELGSVTGVELLYRGADDRYRDYVSSIEDYADETFDIIVIDGRERVQCFARAISKVKPGGRIILDDIDRERYRESLNMVSWPRDVIIGFAPCKPTLAYTAIFARPRL